MSTAAEIVARVRRERGLSMSLLAEMAGVSRSTVSRIESGKFEPTFALLRRVVEAGGFDIDAEPEDDGARG
ncbi:helix-turn-helix domain-containing protein [Myceligenerans indicum]|uniref:Helix-turn-helix transcriptional regulator n=1 Tax=Myceligenerans indicum TaxID=2593663 RepID=A0ABS1LLC2_9MICO|nr:helix-turn-helix transcriptional regulator [Myceligenerans indicum]MBL0887024.1 helix-turn-helix transcriptional regulator [Myceligenerans indicum]